MAYLDSGNAGRTLNSSSHSTSITIPVGTTLLILNSFRERTSAGTSTAPTAGTVAGNATTIVASLYPGNQNIGWSSMQFFINPPSGSQTVAVSGGTGAASDLTGYLWAAYDSMDTTGQPDSSGNAEQYPSTALAISTTVVAASCWIIGLNAAQDATLVSSITNGTSRINTNVAGASGYGIFDTNGTVATGINTLTVNTTSQFIAGIVASFKTATASPKLFTLLGVGT